MKLFNSKVSVIGIFLAAVAFLILDLVSVRWHLYLPVPVFWATVLLMLGAITYQTLKADSYPSYAKVVLFEIAVTCFMFHMIYQIPYYGLRGRDAYLDLASTKGILSSGFVMGDPQYINESSYFPIIHVFSSVLSMITGIDLFSVAKWFPSLLDVILIPLVYLLARSIFKKEKIALLSALLFACLQHHMLFSSLYIRETYALVLAACCVYLYFSAGHSPHPTASCTLSIMSLVMTVFAHHLTGFMLGVLLLSHFLVTRASRVPSLRRTYFGDNITGEKVTTVFLLTAIVAISGYWAYVATLPYYTMAKFLERVFTPGELGVHSYTATVDVTSIQTIRGYVVFYGFFFFHLISGFILLHELLFRKKEPRIEWYSFTVFFFLCGLVGFMSLVLIMPGVTPDRFLMFGWLFGFAPLVVVILKGKSKWLRTIGVFFLIAFMLYNIYVINPYDYDPQARGVALVTSEEDYALAYTFNFSGTSLFGYQNPLMAVYDVHNNLGTVLTTSETELTQFDLIIINKEELELEKIYSQPRTETLAALQRLATGNYANYTKIYESDTLLVFNRNW